MSDETGLSELQVPMSVMEAQIIEDALKQHAEAILREPKDAHFDAVELRITREVLERFTQINAAIKDEMGATIRRLAAMPPMQFGRPPEPERPGGPNCDECNGADGCLTACITDYSGKKPYHEWCDEVLNRVADIHIRAECSPIV